MAVFIRVEDHGVGGAVVVLVDAVPTDENLALGGGDQGGVSSSVASVLTNSLLRTVSPFMKVRRTLPTGALTSALVAS